MVEQPAEAIKIFFCYAPEDTTLSIELKTHLMSLKRLEQITTFLVDCNVEAGADLDQEIETNFTKANIILLLISAYFMASDKCYDTMQLAIERQKAGEAQIVPIIVRSVYGWEETPIGKFKKSILPSNQKPIASCSNHDEGWYDVAQGIGEVVRLMGRDKLSAEDTRILDQLGSRPFSTDTTVINDKNEAFIKPYAKISIGTTLGNKFRIVSVLGKGGMSTVYKVKQVDRSGLFRAAKQLLINPHASEEARKAAIERFDKEIKLLSRLKHQHIPSFILSLQEYVPGRTLEQILGDTQAPLDEERVIKWMMQVCEALTYIHTRTPPIILRDLKPSNIMVTDDDNIQLIDFGIARHFDPNRRTNTENLGTVSYASPEHLGSITAPGQRRSAQNPGRLVQTDARSDVYSLGATMYHLLTNEVPAPIQTPTRGSISAKNPRVRTLQISGSTVCPVEQVIIKAMQQDPVQRFQSAESMRIALQQCLPGQSAPAVIQIPALSPSATTIAPKPDALPGLICPRCGFQNRPGAKFCKHDGQPLMSGSRTTPPQTKSAITARSTTSSASSIQPISARPIQTPQRSAQPAPPPVRPASNEDPTRAYPLGLQNLNMKLYMEAIYQFKLAQLDGTSYEVEYNLGRAYRQYALTLKENDRNMFYEHLKLAAEQFEQAIAIKRDAIDAYFQLGMTYNDLALYMRARDIFTKALQLAPNDAAIYYQLGLAAANQDYNREAEGYYLEGLRYNPDHVLILIALGRLYLRINQVKSAISVFRQAIQKDPGMWEGWYELGHAHMKERQWRLALSALEQARQWNPDAAEIYNAMASCYIKTNKKAEARQMVRMSLLREPNNPEALRLQNQL